MENKIKQYAKRVRELVKQGQLSPEVNHILDDIMIILNIKREEE